MRDGPGPGAASKMLRWAIPAVLVLALGARLAVMPLRELAARYILSDDSFYYLKIAQHLAAEGRSTFDGIHLTNGYHPGWAAVLTALAATGLQADALVRIDLILQILAFGGSALLLALAVRRALRKPGPGPWTAALAFGGNPLLLVFVTNGLETGLACLMMSGFLLLLVRARTSPGAPSGRALVGPPLVAGALTFLTRLDWVIPCGFCLIWIAWFSRRDRASLRAWIASGATLGFLVLVYMAANQAIFGTPLPVSGQVKHSAGTHGMFALRPWHAVSEAIGAVFWPIATQIFSASLYFLALGMVVSVGALVASKHVCRDPVVARAGVLMGWVHAIAYVGLQGGYEQVYYFLPIALSLAWSVAILGASLPLAFRQSARWWMDGTLRAGAAGFAALGVLVFPSILEERWRPHPWRYERFEAAQWLRSAVPDSVLVGSWWAGTLAFYSGRTVVNLDGLVNDVDFLRHLDAGTEWQFVLDERIGMLADYFPGNPLNPPAKSTDPTFARRFRTVSELVRRGYDVAILKSYAKTAGGPGFYVLTVKPGPGPSRQ